MATKILKLEAEATFTKKDNSTGLGFKKLITPGLYNQEKLIKSWYELEKEFLEYQNTLDLKDSISLVKAIETNYTPKNCSLILPFFSKYANDSVSQHLRISSDVNNIGSLAFSPTGEISTKIQTITIPHSVKTIGAYAFSNFNDLIQIEIPSTVLQFDDHLFSKCKNLQEVYIFAKQSYLSDYTFLGCKSLRTVGMTNYITTIGSYCFANCETIERIDLPNGIECINDFAFYNCSKLRDIGNLSNVEYIRDYAFYGCNSLEEISLSSEVQLDDCSFYKCRNLERISFNSTSTRAQNGVQVGQQVFDGCVKLNTISPSDTVFSIIGTEAFANCDSLTSVVWRINTISDRAFYNCKKLNYVDITFASTIGANVFDKCPLIETLKIPTVGKITNGTVPSKNGTDALLGYFFGTEEYAGGVQTIQTVGSTSNTYYIPKALTKVVVGKDGGNIWEAAFENCRNISTIELNQTSFTVTTRAFYGCGLRSLNLERATSIGANAIGSCQSLSELRLPFVGTKEITSSTGASQNTLFGIIFEAVPEDEKELDRAGFYKAKQSHSDAEGIEYYIPESLKIVHTKGKLLHGAFSNCRLIEKINVADLGDSTAIPTKAFYNCQSLNGFELPSGAATIGVSSFEGCTAISKFTIPDFVTTIKERAFYDCSKLSEISLPSSIKTIGASAYTNCTKVTLLNVDCSLELIDGVIFSNLGQDASGITVQFGSTATKIPNNFFDPGLTDDDNDWSKIPKITRIVLHNGITSIGNAAFKNCKYLTGLSIPNSISTIGTSLLEGCENLVSITIPDSVTTISEKSFNNCNSLLSLALPDSLTTIGTNAFANCESLMSVRYGSNSLTGLNSTSKIFENSGAGSGVELTISANINKIPDYAFDGLKIKTIKFEGAACREFGTDAFANNDTNETMEVYITDVDAWIQSAFANKNATPLSAGGKLYENGNEITECTVNYDIGDYVFYGCESIEKVTVDQGAKEIGDHAFSGCTQLNTLEFTEDSELETIGTRSFSGCERLTEVSIPSTVETINGSAFAKCKSITTMTLPFVGKSLDATNQEACFGYIFGEENPNDEENYYDAEQRYNTNDFVIYYIPTSLNSVSINNGETLHYGAFRSCKNLQTIALPNTITSIGNTAFAYCENLEEMVLPSTLISLGASAFWECSKLVSIEIPDAVTTIDGDTFLGCSDLGRVKLGTGTQIIKESAFKDCSSLSDINLEENITQIGDYAFQNCTSLGVINVPNTTTTIGTYAFYNCTNATTITIGTGVTTIGKSAFANCSKVGEINFNAKKLTTTLDYNSPIFKNIGAEQDDITVTFGSSVEEIPEYLFYAGSTNSIYIELPISEINFTEKEGGGYSCKKIGNYAFASCAKVTELTIPSTVESIGQYCLGGCKELQSLTVPFIGMGNPSSLSNNINYVLGLWFATSNQGKDFYYGASMYYTSSSYTTRYIPNSLTKIVITDATYLNYGALDNLESVTSVTLSSGLKGIHSYALRGCKFTELTIPDTVTSIQGRAFDRCSALQSITIPPSITSIGNYAFANCTKLQTINFNATNLTTSSTDPCIFAGSGNSDNPISVNIGGNVTKIPKYLFSNDTNGTLNIGTITFKPDDSGNYSCKTIEDYAFRGCAHTRDMWIPKTVTAIGVSCFGLCKNLTSLTVPFIGKSSAEQGGNTSASDLRYALGYWFRSASSGVVEDGFNNTPITCSDGMTVRRLIPKSLTTITIHEDATTTISWGALRDITSITTVTLPSTITVLGKNSLAGLTNLKTLNYNIKKLTTTYSTSWYAFSNSGISTGFDVYFGEEVQEISPYLFSNSGTSGTLSTDPKVNKFVFLGNAVTSIGSYALHAYSSTSLVPTYDFSGYTKDDSVPTVYSNYHSLINDANATIYLRDQDTLDKWSAQTNWANYADQMAVKKEVSA